MVLSTSQRRRLYNALGGAAAGDAIADILDEVSVLNATEVGFVDGVTAGTAAASKAATLDANAEMNGIGVIKTSDTLIATAAVLTLNATPVSCVAAPGAGITLEFLGAYIFLDYNAAAYVDAAGEDVVFSYTDASGVEVSIRADGGEFDGTADALVWVPPIGAVGAVGGLTMVANAAIVLHLLSGEWATGDSPLKVRVYYREIRTASLEAIA